MPEAVSEMSKEMQELIKENPPPENLLPINAVFTELYYIDGYTGRATIDFNLSCEEKVVIPNPIRLIIKTPHREIFNQGVNLCHYHSGKYPGRRMMQATVILSEAEFTQISNNPAAEVILSDNGSRESTFQIYI